MSKIVKKWTGTTRSAVGGSKVPLHGEGSNSMSVGATRRPTGGAAVPISATKDNYSKSPAMGMKQPFGTTGKTV